jgi:hypothetical protein
MKGPNGTIYPIWQRNCKILTKNKFVGEMFVEKMFVGEMFVEEISLEEMSVGMMSFNKKTCCQKNSTIQQKMFL